MTLGRPLRFSGQEGSEYSQLTVGGRIPARWARTADAVWMAPAAPRGIPIAPLIETTGICGS